MRFSNEHGRGEGVRLSAQQRRPTLKEIREKWSRYTANPSEESTPINWGVVRAINDVLSYLEALETAPPRYVPEPRLGPQPESEEEAKQARRVVSLEESEQTEKTLHHLNGRVQELRERLGKVLIPVMAANPVGGTAATEPVCSPLTERLKSFRKLAQDSIDTIEDILNRLDV